MKSSRESVSSSISDEFALKGGGERTREEKGDDDVYTAVKRRSRCAPLRLRACDARGNQLPTYGTRARFARSTWCFANLPLPHAGGESCKIARATQGLLYPYCRI